MPEAHVPIVVLCTFPNPEVAGEIARHLVNEKLCACVSMIPQITSVYTWNQQTLSETEVLGFIKTTDKLFEQLSARIHQLHPYHAPEVLSIPISSISAPYASWLLQSLHHQGPYEGAHQGLK